MFRSVLQGQLGIRPRKVRASNNGARNVKIIAFGAIWLDRPGLITALLIIILIFYSIWSLFTLVLILLSNFYPKYLFTQVLKFKDTLIIKQNMIRKVNFNEENWLFTRSVFFDFQRFIFILSHNNYNIHNSLSGKLFDIRMFKAKFSKKIETLKVIILKNKNLI